MISKGILGRHLNRKVATLPLKRNFRMIEHLEKLKGILSVGTLPLIGIFIFTALFIFSPDSFLENAGILKFKEEYSSYIGLAFVFSISLLVATSIYGIWNTIIKDLIKEEIKVFFLKKQVKYLTEEEKKLLRRFILENTRSLNLSIKDGVVLGLERRGVIARVGTISTNAISLSFPFNIQPWAWDYLNKNKNLLTFSIDNGNNLNK